MTYEQTWGDKMMDKLIPIFLIGIIICIIIGFGASVSHYKESSAIISIEPDAQYLFTTKQVGSHEILIVSNRYDDKSFEVIDLGEIKVEKSQ
jgi:hypothetical protein